MRPLTYTFNQAQKYAAKLDAHGYQGWRVPTLVKMSLGRFAPIASWAS
jgi:hypothetical protein